ncbi:MAG TPA: hypothetical protein VMJ10_26920 [Kofleriaceae bacterium]|nr:hypothetical protein [Kofleriaceae bacterium]
MTLRLLVVTTALLAAPALASADRIKVAVVPGIAVNLDAGRVDALSQDLAEALATELDVDAIGGLEVRRKLPPDGLPPECVATPSCTADVAKRVGANQLLFVVMVDSGGAVQMDATWIEPAAGKQAQRPAIDLTSSVDEAAKEKFQAVARQLLPDAPVRAKPQAQAAPSSVNLKIDTRMTEATPRHLTLPAYITGGATIAGLGVGIAFGLATRSKYDACDDAAAPCSDGKKSTIRNFALAADAGLFVATGAAIATAVLWATSSEGPHVIVTPTPDGGAGVTAVGSF